MESDGMSDGSSFQGANGWWKWPEIVDKTFTQVKVLAVMVQQHPRLPSKLRYRHCLRISFPTSAIDIPKYHKMCHFNTHADFVYSNMWSRTSSAQKSLSGLIFFFMIQYFICMLWPTPAKSFSGRILTFGSLM